MATTRCLLAAGLAVGLVAAQPSDAAQKQKSAAEAQFGKVHSGKASTAETAHLFVVGAPVEARLKALAASLEKTYQTAYKVLDFDEKSPPWPGRLTVFVFAEGADVRSFIRQAEKRSPRADEAATTFVTGELPHVALAMGAGRDAANLDTNAAQHVAGALLQAKVQAPLPDWVLTGFAKATVVQGSNLAARKRQVAKLGLPISTAWNDDMPAEARAAVAASAMEFLMYAKGAKPTAFIAAFKPGQGQTERSTNDALNALDLTAEKLDAQWKQWLLKP